MKYKRTITKRNEERFRVITFDELLYKNPSLTEYIDSLKTWFHKASAGLSKSSKYDVATSTRAARKSRSSSAIAMRSISNNVLRKYTRSRTLSMEDLKRLWLIKNVFSLDKLQSSQIFSRKRSLRAKVKNGEEYLNKWDRDIQVLYSNETNKFSRSESQYSPEPSPTDGEAPASGSSTSGSSDKMSLIINACNCGRKECKSIPNRKFPGDCNFCSKFCASKNVCPCTERFSREDRQNKASQSRDAKLLVDCACSAVAACFDRPRRQEANEINKTTDYANTQNSNKLCTCDCSKLKETGQKNNHTNTTNASNNICTEGYCPKQMPAGPKTHYANTQTPNNENTWRNRKKDYLQSGYAKTQTSNEICTLCYCPIEKADELKTDCADTQTSNNKLTCRCPKTDHVNTQTSKSICPECGGPKSKKASPKTDYGDTQTSNNKFTCRCPKTDHVNTQTSNNTCPVCGYPKSKKAYPKTDYADTQTSSNMIRTSYPKRKEDGPKTNHATQTFIDLFACGCSKQKELSSETDYAYTQTSNNLHTGRYQEQNVSGPKTDDTKLQTSNNICTYGAQAKKKKKLKHYKAFEPPELSSQGEHNKLAAYFNKLRRRNIERQSGRNAALHRLRNAHEQSGIAYTTTTDEKTSGPQSTSTSRARRQSVLSAIKYCPCCVSQIFPDSALYSTDTSSQTPFIGTKETHKSTSAQTSKLKIEKDVTPDQKRQYILYYNNVRGWLVKPLRVRKSSTLGVKLGLTQKLGEKPGNVGNSPCNTEIYHKPDRNHDCKCTRNVHRCNCRKNSNERIFSRARESKLSRNFLVRNPSGNNLSRKVHEKLLPRNVHEHNLSTIAHECNCSPCSHEKNVSRNVNEKTKTRKVNKKNSPKKVELTNSSGNVHEHNLSTNVHECNCYPCSYEKNVSGTANEKKISRKVNKKNSPKKVELMNSSGNLHEHNVSSKFSGCNCSKNASECIYSLYAHDNLFGNVPVNNSYVCVPAHISYRKKHKCNCSNIKNSLPRICKSRRKRKYYCNKGKRKNYNDLCYSCKHMGYSKARSNVVYPCCFRPRPCCIRRKNKKCMTKKIHICGRLKMTSRIKRAIQNLFCCCESEEFPVGCEWLFCSAPRSVFLEWCSGCKKCCKSLLIILTAVLFCPILVLIFILHDLFFPCI